MRFHPDAIYTQLYPHFQERIRANEPLSHHGALGIGGPADLWITLESTQELKTLVSFCAAPTRRTDPAFYKELEK